MLSLVRNSALYCVFLFCSLFLTVENVSAADGHCADNVGEDIASVSPLSENISSQRLAILLQHLDEAKFDVRALVVMRNCRIVLERYKAGLSRSYNHAMYSVTKSISSTLIGALLYQGKLTSINKPIPTLIDRPRGINDDEWRKLESVTLKNAMQMASGFDYKHDPVSNPIYDTRQDRVRVVLDQTFIAVPGSRFNYSDADATLTGTVIAGASGRSLLDFAEASLFEPLHMRNYAWWFPDQGGRVPGGWGLRMRPMDMLKLGQLYLQNGEWNGVRIFSSDYREMAWAPGVSNRYGLHWWIGRVNGLPIFFANGFKGQRIYVIPGLNIVIALAASLPGKEETAVTAEVVNGVIEAANRNTSEISSEADQLLHKAESDGFNGETRIRQDMQDSPRRF